MSDCANCGRRFPIMGGPSLPWAMLLPHERQAICNHAQNLEGLASRGGMDPSEALAVLDDRPWQRMEPRAARAEIVRRLDAWDALTAARTPPAPGLVEAARNLSEWLTRHGYSDLQCRNGIALNIAPDLCRAVLAFRAALPKET